MRGTERYGLVFGTPIWQSMSAQLRPILCIAGPTASGKSQLALAYAKHQQYIGQAVEIICVDSATIYRGMAIGTAKPSLPEQAIASHHLIDILDPTERYSAGEFVRDALRLIGEILARGSEPILVGGTMLYFKALIEGIDDLPTANLNLRAAIDQEAQAVGWPALHQALAQVDPVTAARLSPNDSQRISRALEVFRSTGIPLSNHYKAQAGTDKPLQAAPTLSFRLVALEPENRSWLHARIAQRFEAMLCSNPDHGLIHEVMQLKARGDLTIDLPSMRCVGYRQVWEYLDSAQSAKDFNDLRERGIAATRQLAKRQLTWLRGWPNKHTLRAEDDLNTNLARLSALHG